MMREPGPYDMHIVSSARTTMQTVVFSVLPFSAARGSGCPCVLPSQACTSAGSSLLRTSPDSLHCSDLVAEVETDGRGNHQAVPP